MMSQDEIRQNKMEQKSDEHQQVCRLPSDTAISISHPLTFHEPQKQSEVNPPMDFQHICDFHTAMQNVNTL